MGTDDIRRTERRQLAAIPETERLAGEANLSSIANFTGGPGVELSALERKTISGRDITLAADTLADTEHAFQQALERDIQLAQARRHVVDATELAPPTKTELNHEIAAINDRHVDNLNSRQAKGERAEAIAKATIKERGLPGDDGHWHKVDTVISGQFDQLHGIDLVAVRDGKPMIVEVKYTQHDNAAHLSGHVQDIEDRTTSLLGTHGQETNKQMGDGWVRDRWNKLITTDRHRLALYRAGVDSAYLKPENFETADSQMRQELLKNKWVVVVSERGADAIGGNLVRQANERNLSLDHIFSIKL